MKGIDIDAIHIALDEYNLLRGLLAHTEFLSNNTDGFDYHIRIVGVELPSEKDSNFIPGKSGTIRIDRAIGNKILKPIAQKALEAEKISILKRMDEYKNKFKDFLTEGGETNVPTNT